MAPKRERKRKRGPEKNSGRRFFFPIVLLSLAFTTGCEFQYQPLGRQDRSGELAEQSRAEIVAMLTSSAVSWNEGNLDGFLDDYWNSDSLTFSGPTGVTRGWDEVRTRYLDSYWAPGTTRDSLSFQEIEVSALGDEHVLALGRYLLFPREDGDTEPSSGFFSLVLRKVGEDWRIVHDHTSATPPEEDPEGGEV